MCSSGPGPRGGATANQSPARHEADRKTSWCELGRAGGPHQWENRQAARQGQQPKHHASTPRATLELELDTTTSTPACLPTAMAPTAPTQRPTMRHSSAFLIPPSPPPSSSSPAPGPDPDPDDDDATVALVVLNQPLPRFAPLLWSRGTPSRRCGALPLLLWTRSVPSLPAALQYVRRPWLTRCLSPCPGWIISGGAGVRGRRRQPRLRRHAGPAPWPGPRRGPHEVITAHPRPQFLRPWRVCRLHHNHIVPVAISARVCRPRLLCQRVACSALLYCVAAVRASDSGQA